MFVPIVIQKSPLRNENPNAWVNHQKTIWFIQPTQNKHRKRNDKGLEVSKINVGGRVLLKNERRNKQKENIFPKWSNTI